MSRALAIERACQAVDSGSLAAALARRIAFASESEEPERAGTALRAYLEGEIEPSLRALGFEVRAVDNPVAPRLPMLMAERIEDAALPTVLMYAHGDVVRGHAPQWREGLSPWLLTVEGERWYGRGTADNKGQHSINLAALEHIMAARGGRLGFNLKLLFEMGEEAGSPGLREVCQAHRAALASLVDARGRIRVPALRPTLVPAAVKRALADIEVGGGDDDPPIDLDWGEPGLTPAERVIGWNSIEVLAMTAGNPAQPVGAIPGSARMWCQLRFVVGTRLADIAPALRAHLDEAGFGVVELHVGAQGEATRLDPDDAWVKWAIDSMRRTTGKPPALLPNLGGSLPNDIFANLLGLPTLWVPHSYPGCAQHAPNEHLLASVAREGLAIMAGLFWDLGDAGAAVRASRVGHEPSGAQASSTFRDTP